MGHFQYYQVFSLTILLAMHSCYMRPNNTKCAVCLQEVKGIHASGQTNEFNELGTVGRDGDSSELKKRGLCLVPLSMLSKYLG